MKKIDIQHIRNKKENGVANNSSILKFFSASLIKLSIAIAIFLLIAATVFAVDVEINQGRFIVTNGFMAGIHAAGDFIDYDANDNTYFKAPGATNSIYFETPSETPRMTILGSNGNVGIGTTTPSQKLEVSGNVKATDFTCADCLSAADIGDGLGVNEIDESVIQRRVSGTCAAGNSVRVINQDGTVTCEADDVGGSGDGYSLDAADGSPTDVVYVDNAGNVGVGTSAPSSKLDVVGNVKATSFIGDGSQLTGVGGIPSGAILMFSNACPAGYTRLAALDNKFVMGGTTYGVAGGSNTHNHTAGLLTGPSHTHTFSDTVSSSTSTDGGHLHTVNSHSHTYSGWTGNCNHEMAQAQAGSGSWYFAGGGCGHYYEGTTSSASPGTNSAGSHSHSLSDNLASGTTSLAGASPVTGTTASASNVPEYITVVFCLKN
ncbi:MAG: hypothetical protein V1859_08965 [archaeon]